MSQQLGAHHRRQGERDGCGDKNCNRQRHGKLAEQAPDDVSHEQQGNQHGDQRNCEGDDGETNLLRSFESCLQRRFALFDVPADVLDHDDGVVNDEAG